MTKKELQEFKTAMEDNLQELIQEYINDRMQISRFTWGKERISEEEVIEFFYLNKVVLEENPKKRLNYALVYRKVYQFVRSLNTYFWDKSENEEHIIGILQMFEKDGAFKILELLYDKKDMNFFKKLLKKSKGKQK